MPSLAGAAVRYFSLQGVSRHLDGLTDDADSYFEGVLGLIPKALDALDQSEDMDREGAFWLRIDVAENLRLQVLLLM